MPFILRGINQNRWFDDDGNPWSTEDELKAHALTDLSTGDRGLSVWHVEDSESNLRRVVTALAANRVNLRSFDYVLLDWESVLDLGIEVVQTDGDSPDEEANRLWHYELTNLSPDKVMGLARLVQRAIQEDKRGRFLQKDIRQAIADGIASKQIDQTKVRLIPTDLEKVRRLIKS